MRTIRRFYFYLVAIISLEVVLWGVIGLARTLFNGSLSLAGSESLAGALALLLVGMPIFLIHWLWAQKAAREEREEQSARLRAFFLYGALIGTLVPVVQNSLALINRFLLSAVQLSTRMALLGGQQTFSDNLTAILLNLGAAAYFWNILRQDWPLLSETEAFNDTRRLYRYLWLSYSLAMTLFGLQQALSYIFDVWTLRLGFTNQENAANGVALLLLGAPLWWYTWRVCQQALQEDAEQASALRFGWLYLVNFGGLVVTLVAVGNFVYAALRGLFGQFATGVEFWHSARAPLQALLSVSGLWWYYNKWFSHQSALPAWQKRGGAVRRLYFYPLAFLGLTASVIGISLLLAVLIDISTGNGLWAGDIPNRLAGALATLAVGLPLWLRTWMPMQAETWSENAAAHESHRSVLRRFYLYAVLFASVIGVMVTGGILAYTLLNAALKNSTPPDFLRSTLNELQLLGWFAVLLAYHLQQLRQDGIRLEKETAPLETFTALAVCVNDQEPWLTRLQTALGKEKESLRLQTWQMGMPLPEDPTRFGAIILPAALALNPPQELSAWLSRYTGPRVLLPLEAENLYWAASLSTQPEKLAAQFLQRLAEGQPARQAFEGLSALQITAYVFAGLFGLQILFILFSLLFSLLVNF